MASPILPGSGLGSGLDIGAIVTALVNADKAPKQTQIDTQTKNNSLKISGVGSLKSALTAFQTAMTNLGSKTAPAFAGFSATSGTPSVLTATSDNTAVAGTYNVFVSSLATGSKVASAAFAGGAASAIPSGTLKITQNGIDIPVTIPANATLQSTRDAINASAGPAGISANIVTDSSGASRLVVSSTKTGAGTDLKLSGIAGLEIDGTQEMGATPTAGSSGSINGLAKDASLTIDGLPVTSKTNTVTGAVSGLTLNLVTTTAPGTTVTVGVEPNTKGLQTSIQSFVDAYNTLKKTIDTLSKATPDEDGKLTVQAAFTGDSMTRKLMSDIRAELTNNTTGGPVGVLSQIGVMTDQNTGELKFDAAAFTKSMATPGTTGQIQQLFAGTNDTNGLLSRMSKSLDPYLKPASITSKGMLDQRLADLTANGKKIANQQEALDIRVANLTKTLTAKYNAMDLLVGQMKATASNITSFFASLTAQQSAK